MASIADIVVENARDMVDGMASLELSCCEYARVHRGSSAYPPFDSKSETQRSKMLQSPMGVSVTISLFICSARLHNLRMMLRSAGRTARLERSGGSQQRT